MSLKQRTQGKTHGVPTGYAPKPGPASSTRNRERRQFVRRNGTAKAPVSGCSGPDSPAFIDYAAICDHGRDRQATGRNDLGGKQVAGGIEPPRAAEVPDNPAGTRQPGIDPRGRSDRVAGDASPRSFGGLAKLGFV